MKCVVRSVWYRRVFANCNVVNLIFKLCEYMKCIEKF